ncbi:MAG: C40 family peptidase [Bacteroidetes bacterium]|nr:C40 family peptidase [Bacteroidota bacterium]
MKLLLALFVFFVFGFSMAQDSVSVQVDSLLEFAKKQLGVTYQYGTSKPGVSFDCSGFTSYVYRSFGINCPRTSSEYIHFGSKVELEACQKGDCLVFTGTNPSNRRAGHVGIVVENNDGIIQFIHCSSAKNHYGVVISSLNGTKYAERLLEVRRISELESYDTSLFN